MLSWTNSPALIGAITSWRVWITNVGTRTREVVAVVAEEGDPREVPGDLRLVAAEHRLDLRW